MKRRKVTALVLAASMIVSGLGQTAAVFGSEFTAESVYEETPEIVVDDSVAEITDTSGAEEVGDAADFGNKEAWTLDSGTQPEEFVSDEAEADLAFTDGEEDISDEGAPEDAEYGLNFNCEYREGDWTWVFENQSQTINVDTSGLGGLDDYTIKWNLVDRADESQSSAAVIITDGGLDGDEFITLQGVEGFGYNEESGWAVLYAYAYDNNGSPDEPVAECRIDVQVQMQQYYRNYPLSGPGENQMLQGRSIHIDPSIHWWIDNAEHPYGYDCDLPINSIEITGQYRWDDEADNDEGGTGAWIPAEGIIGLSGDETNGWDVEGLEFGYADLDIHYFSAETNEEEIYPVEVWVNGDVYWLNWEYPNGTNQMLVGDQMTIDVTMTREYLDGDQEPRQEDIQDFDLSLAWDDDNLTYNPDMVDIKLTGQSLTITANQRGGTEIYLRAMRKDESGESYEACATIIYVNVENAYCNLTPVSVENVPLGEALDLGSVPWKLTGHYTDEEGVNQSGIITIAENEDVRLRLEGYDENAWEVQNGTEDALVPTLVRNGNWGTSIVVIAEGRELDDEHNPILDEQGGEIWTELARRELWFDHIEYWTDIQYSYGSREASRVYTDAPLTLTMIQDENSPWKLPEGCTVEWEVTQYDENGELPEVTAAAWKVNEDGSITLTANESHVNEKVRVSATVYYQAGENEESRFEISYTDTWVDACESIYNYQFNAEEEHRLPGDGIWIDKNLNYHEESSENPDGYDDMTEITNVTVNVIEGSVKALSCDEQFDEEGNRTGWYLYAHNLCTAEVTLEYTPVNGHGTGEYKFMAYVDGEMYNIDVTSDTASMQMIPGETMELKAAVSHAVAGESYEEDDESVWVTWEIGEVHQDQDNAEPVTLDYEDSVNGRICTVTANSAADIQILVRAYRNAEAEDGSLQPEEVSCTDLWININDYQIRDYEKEEDNITATDTEQYLAPGQQIVIRPVLIERTEAYSGSIYYRWEYDETLEISPDELELESQVVEDESGQYSGPQFTVKKNANNWTSARLIAEIRNQDGGYEEVASREWHFNEIDYGFDFDELRGDGYSWVYTDETMDLYLNTYDPDLTARNCEIEWQVGICDEDGNFTHHATEAEYGQYHFLQDKLGIRLNGTDMLIWIRSNEGQEDNSWFNVRVIVRDKTTEEELFRRDVGFDIREPYEEFDYDYEYELLQGRELYYDNSKINCYVENKEFPHGKEYSYTITDIQFTDIEGTDVFSCEQVENGAWKITAENPGRAVIKMTAQDEEGNPVTIPDREKCVADCVYRMSIASSTEDFRLKKGNEFYLQIIAYQIAQVKDEEGNGYNEVTEYQPDQYTIEYYDYDTNLLSVSKDGCVTAIGEEGETTIRIKITIPQEEGDPIVIDDWVNVGVPNSYYHLNAEKSYDAAPDGSVTVDPVLLLMDEENPEGISVSAENVRFTLEEVGGNVLNINDLTITAADPTQDSVVSTVKIIAETTDDYGYNITEERWCTVAFCNHTKSEEWRTEVWESCTTAGSKIQWCTKCGAVMETKTVEELGHSYESSITKEATCTEEGEKTYTCKVCDDTYTEAIEKLPHTIVTVIDSQPTCGTPGKQHSECSVCHGERTELADIPATGNHTFGEYVVTKEATALEEGIETRTCSVCQATESRAIANLTATITVPATSIPLKVKQVFSFKVTGLAKGDYVKSATSSKTKYVKVSANKNGTIKLTAQKKTGTSKITVVTAAGARKVITVKVQKATVATKKITGLSKKLTIKKGKTSTLKPGLSPISSTQKITYTSSNKKVATVTSKGKIKGVKKGKAVITVKSGKASFKCTVTVK